MKTAIIATKEQTKETGESVLIVEAREVGLILAALEEYSRAHPRNKRAAALVNEFEALPCQSPKNAQLPPLSHDALRRINRRFAQALEFVRDTAIAMKDAQRINPRSVLLTEGAERIRAAACRALDGTGK